MAFFSTEQWIVVALVFVAGWLVGLMSGNRNARYRRDYERERDAHVALRRDYEAHLQQHGMVSDTRIPPLTH